jgi:aerobic carbon-monoxide dehydrogenase medium subunit
VTLPPFEVHRPGSVAEAAGLLRGLGDDAVVYSGGTELLLLFKLGLAHFGHLVDVKRIPALSGIRREDGWLVIGAATTHRAIERSAVVKEHCSGLVAMERRVANVRVRNVGTLGGNLCFADPHSDPATFLLALDATVTCARDDAAVRRVSLVSFVQGAYETDLAPDELLTEVRVPPLPRGAAISHQRFAIHERPSATVTSLVRWQAGRLDDVRIAIGSVGARPLRAAAAEHQLLNASREDLEHGLDRAAEAAADVSEPVSDDNGSADYKHHLVQVLVRRAVREAAAPHS